MDKIELGTPFRTVIIKILSCNPKMLSVFGRTKEKDLFFKELLTIGCDFYELLELFANCEAINNESINCIVENVPNVEIIENYNDKEIRRMIPHWSSSKYHSATIKDICQELKMHIESDSNGTFVYNSNNSKNKKVYNDTYILLISDSTKFFFDINRKKSYKIINDGEVTENV